jgi:predicted TPR repeat methyltransferase
MTRRAERSLRAEWVDRVRLPSVAEPAAGRVEQDEEWCEIEERGAWRRLRFHSYAEIFARAGLYEHLFHGLLKCCSPARVAAMLEESLRESGVDARDHRILDVGAGNGMLGEELRARGFGEIFGVDLLPEAKAAQERDRPGIYANYVIGDLAKYDDEMRARVEAFSPTILACVAALGFGDIPPRAWFNAMSAIPVGGLLAFNIRADFLDARYAFGFSELVRRMTSANVIRLESLQRYKHRLSVAGEPLWYTAIIATKLGPIPPAMLVDG